MVPLTVVEHKTVVEVQLSAVIQPSLLAFAVPATYAHVATLLSSAAHEPSVTP